METLMRPLLAVVLSCLFLSGCNRPPAAKTTKTKGTIGLSVMTMANPFFKEIADAMKQEAAKHGYEVIAVSGDLDVTKQHNQVKDFLVKGVSAIVLCPSNSQAISPAIKEANEKSVPVFTADLACLDKSVKVVSHIATDNLAGGKEAGRAMIEALGEVGGKVLVLDFKPAESCLKRVEGFKEVIGEHNRTAKSGKISIVAELPCGGVKAEGLKATQDTLQAHPDLAGIFAINDPAALGAVAALETQNKSGQVKIIAFDGQPEGKQAILEGKIYADPIQHPDEIGRKTAQIIAKYFEGEKVPAEILIETNLYRKADAEKDPALKR
jgi:ribose transport system substrate-binding protein